MTPTTSAIVGSPAGSQLTILTGFIGNVARKADTRSGDFLKVTDQVNTLLTQTHDVNMPLGWFSAEAWMQIVPGWTPAPYYLVQEMKSTQAGGDDVILVPNPADAKKVICYITGLEGDWSKTRPDGQGGTDQPYAQIYKGPVGEIHLKAWPPHGDPDGVSAYASCLRIRP